MKSLNRVLFFLGALLFFGVAGASADTLLSYQFSGSVSASFDLPVMPTVIVFGTGQGFEVTPINLMINGAPSNDFLTFYNSAVGGGFGACSGGECLDILVAGAQLYSGPEATPTMLPPGGGNFTDRRTGDPAGTFATPEPSTIGLMTFGLIALALAVARFKRSPAIMLA
jgi:hypothetical protein